MQIGILHLSDSTHESELNLVIQCTAMEPHAFLWHETPEKLADFAGYIIIDTLSNQPPAIQSIQSLPPLTLQILHTQSAAGKPILGIGNGAHILVEMGLVPGVEHNQPSIHLKANRSLTDSPVKNNGFYAGLVHIRLSNQYQLNAFTRHLKPSDILQCPIANAEGCFVIPPGLLMEMQIQGLNVFQYCHPDGNINTDGFFDPTGSTDHIAAVTNKAGNIMAMLPHPENTLAGERIFHSMCDYIQSGYVPRVRPLNYWPR